LTLDTLDTLDAVPRTLPKPLSEIKFKDGAIGGGRGGGAHLGKPPIYNPLSGMAGLVLGLFFALIFFSSEKTAP